jgi:hypothetical protein
MTQRILCLACFTLFTHATIAAWLHDMAMAFVQDRFCPPHKYVGLLYSSYKLQPRPDTFKDYAMAYHFAHKSEGLFEQAVHVKAVQVGAKITATRFPEDRDVQAVAAGFQRALAVPEGRIKR